MKRAFSYVKLLIKEINDDNATTLAAAQAYYFLLSIVPMLILLLSILPFLSIDPNEALRFLKTIIPPDTAELFEKQIISVVTTQSSGLLTLGVLGTIWSASNAVNSFIESTNSAYDVEETRGFIKVRLISIVLTIASIFAIVVALTLPIFGRVIIDFIDNIFNLPETTKIIFLVLRWLISVAVITSILAFLYHFAPNKTFAFKEVFPGAIVATILWQLISLGFSFYIENFSHYSATYGSLGGVIILILWFFLTSLTLIIGAEINAINHKKRTIT